MNARNVLPKTHMIALAVCDNGEIRKIQHRSLLPDEMPARGNHSLKALIDRFDGNFQESLAQPIRAAGIESSSDGFHDSCFALT